MVAPSDQGTMRCMRMVPNGLDTAIDYFNTLDSPTPLGDITEAPRGSDNVPPLSSAKVLSGHSLGAASVHEAIYCLLMMQGGFMAGSANIEHLDPRAEGFPILQQQPPEDIAMIDFKFADFMLLPARCDARCAAGPDGADLDATQGAEVCERAGGD